MIFNFIVLLSPLFFFFSFLSPSLSHFLVFQLQITFFVVYLKYFVCSNKSLIYSNVSLLQCDSSSIINPSQIYLGSRILKIINCIQLGGILICSHNIFPFYLNKNNTFQSQSYLNNSSVRQYSQKKTFSESVNK